MSTDQKIRALSQRIREEVMNGGAKNFDSVNFDEPALSYKQKNNSDMLGYDEVDTMIGLSSYAVRVHYVPLVGVLPVEIELFGVDWNNGVVTGQTLVFTNAVGDTAVVTGITAPITIFQNRLRSAAFKAAFVREQVANAAQFANQVTLRKDSVYGSFGGNRLNPNEFLTPEQFQLLRVDIPLNTKFDSERRFILSVNPTETLAAGGTTLTFFVNAVATPVKALDGGPSSIEMKGDGILSSQPAASNQQQINQLIGLQTTQAQLVKNIAQLIQKKS